MFKKFWKTGKEKRQEFLDKLKGEITFQVKEDLSAGAEFMFLNKGTGVVDSYVYIGGDRWTCFGTGVRIGDRLSDVFTRRQLEMHLTRLVREAKRENAIHIIDEGNYLTWAKPQ